MISIRLENRIAYNVTIINTGEGVGAGITPLR